MSNKIIKCMYFNHRFNEKPLGKQCGWVQKNLTQSDITIEDLADALCHGASFKPGVIQGGMKAENWIQQQLFGLAECLGKNYSQSKIDKIGKYTKMLVYHDLIRILDDSQVPKDLLYKSIKYSGTDKRSGNHVNFYSIPSWVIQQLNKIEDNGKHWKEKGYRIDGVSFDMFY